MANLPVLTYTTDGLPEDRAFEIWQAAMAPLFHVERARYCERLPRGNVTSILIGEVIANRSAFTAQHLRRDPARIAATPDHLLLQAYTRGGFHGELAGRTVTVSKGMVAVTDLRRTVDVRAARSDSVGLALPRRFAAQVGAGTLTPHLDAARNHQLATWMIAFYRRLSRMGEADVPALMAEIAAVLQGLCGTPPDDAGVNGVESDLDLLARAERLIQAEFSASDCLPARLAEQLGVSRATLYRVFAPLGGVRRQIQERRLLAAHEALSDPLEPRRLARIASDLGFGSAALFSRSFRERFGQSPDAYRTVIARTATAARPDTLEPVRAWWSRLGQ